MNAINPSLSAALSLQPQNNQMNARSDLRMDDKTTSQATSGGNSTVILSDAAQAMVGGSSELAASQNVRGREPLETGTMNASETTSGMSTVSDLSSKARAYVEVSRLV